MTNSLMPIRRQHYVLAGENAFARSVFSCITCASLSVSAETNLQGNDLGNKKDTVITQIAAVPLQTAQEDPYAKFDKYITKGFSVPLPPTAGFVDHDPDGLRSKLDTYGFGYWGWGLTEFIYDVKNHGHDDGAQRYAGQRPTWNSYNYLFGTYDLSRHGVPDGQISIALSGVYTSWTATGPSAVRISTAQYYQTLFDKRVELAVGLLGNSFNYVGLYVGGNLAAGTFGTNASIPTQVGLSTFNQSKPGLNLKFNFPWNFYYRVGAQRSLSPDGAVAERKSNRYGVSPMAGAHAGYLVIQELGYRESATTTSHDTWLRFGYIDNDAKYSSKKYPSERVDDNWAAYGLMDFQLFHLHAVDRKQAARGLYAGVSYMRAPNKINTFVEYRELRLYTKGPFDARPYDMISLVVSRNDFSRYAIRSARMADKPTVNESTAISMSYSGQIIRGLTLSGGLSYIDHPLPVYTEPGQGSGLNFRIGLHFYF